MGQIWAEGGGGLVPQPADVSKVATGDRAKMAAPPPKAPWEVELEGYSGKANGGREPSVKTKWIFSLGQARLSE